MMDGPWGLEILICSKPALQTHDKKPCWNKISKYHDYSGIKPDTDDVFFTGS